MRTVAFRWLSFTNTAVTTKNINFEKSAQWLLLKIRDTDLLCGCITTTEAEVLCHFGSGQSHIKLRKNEAWGKERTFLSFRVESALMQQITRAHN